MGSNYENMKLVFWWVSFICNVEILVNFDTAYRFISVDNYYSCCIAQKILFFLYVYREEK
jgi:hypothetical protein